MKSKFVAVLVFFLAFAGGRARKLTQAPSPTPAASGGYTTQLRTALTQNASASGPILFKTFEAAYFTLLAAAGQSENQLVDGSQIIQFGNSSQLLVTWNSGNASLTMAFATSSTDNSSLTQQISSLTPVTYLNGFFGASPPSASPAAVQLFNASVTNATSSGGAIQTLTRGANSTAIGRVLCTGFGGGGALAHLCGPWAQLNFPNAQVRVISFGAPRVGDDRFNWALQQLVDLPYIWLTASDNRTVAQTPRGPLQLPNITRVIPEGNTTAEGTPGSIQYYTTLLNNTLKANGSAIPITLQTNFSYGYLPGGKDSQFVASAAPQGGGFVSKVGSAIGTLADTASAAGSAISNLVGNLFSPPGSPAPAPAPSDLSGLAAGSSGGTPLNSGGSVSSASNRAQSTACTPILCKLKTAISQSCAAYADGASLGPGSVTVTAQNTSTNVAVAWNADTKVATFAWRGTQETEDWKQNLRLSFSDDTSSSYFEELYTGTRVYEGELNQFRAVTDQAAGADQSIRAQLEKLAGGTLPARVDCVGHSLGAGLSTICGPWAAEQWPMADVRVVNFGSPKAGNLQFAESVYATVGRIYRVVNQQDAVPSLPPFSSYVHADFALWMNGSTIFLDDRPPMDIDTLSWDAHGCDDQYKPPIEASTNVTLPSWIASAS